MVGFSGAPLRRLAASTLAFMAEKKEKLPLIGIGGIMTAEDALQRLSSGASLIQLYTGLVYEGPFLPKRIKGLLRRVDRNAKASDYA